MKTVQHVRNGDTVQLEIAADTLEHLFASGALCAADLRCLNAASKASVWRMCLTSCVARGQCDLARRGACQSCMGATNQTDRSDIRRRFVA